MRDNLTDKRGFTLIELLVVIAIIAILAAILFPVLMNAKNSAKQTQCMSNLKQLGVSMQMYLNNSNGTFPVCNLNAAQSVGDTYGTLYSGQRPLANNMQLNYVKKYAIWGQLDRYIKNRQVWVCPTRGGAATGDLVLNARFTSFEYRQMYFVGFTPWGQSTPALAITRGKVLRENDFPSTTRSYCFREIAPFHDYRLADLPWMPSSKGWASDSKIVLHFVDGHVKAYPVNKVFSQEASAGNSGWDLIWPRIGGFPAGYLGEKRDLD